jgi:uncharacterized protein YuzE
MRITYSKEADVLFISFTPPMGRVASVENVNGDILRIDTLSGNIIGVTIQLFMYRIGAGEKIEIPEIGFSIPNPMATPTVENLHIKANQGIPESCVFSRESSLR